MVNLWGLGVPRMRHGAVESPPQIGLGHVLLGGGFFSDSPALGRNVAIFRLITFGLHGVHLAGAAGVELGEGGARKVLVRLQLREAVRFHLAVVGDQKLASDCRDSTHLPELGARADPLCIGLGGFESFGVRSRTGGRAFTDPQDFISRELLFTASGQQRNQRDGHDSQQNVFQELHVDLLVKIQCTLTPEHEPVPHKLISHRRQFPVYHTGDICQ